jgi:hypothetical protein
MPVLFGKVHRGSLAVTHVLTFKGVTVVVDVTISEELRTIQNTTIMTLLHEMLHVEQPRPQGHGWRFDRRMLKLAKAGAFNGLW